MIKILIYDKYTNDYYEVIPVKKIENVIEELKTQNSKIDNEITSISEEIKKIGLESVIDNMYANVELLFNEKEKILHKIEVLQQLIKENCESEG